VTDPVHEISAELQSVGQVRAHYVDVEDLSVAEPPLPPPSWRGRLGRTFVAAGLGTPYMLGLRGRREPTPSH